MNSIKCHQIISNILIKDLLISHYPREKQEKLLYIIVENCIISLVIFSLPHLFELYQLIIMPKTKSKKTKNEETIKEIEYEKTTFDFDKKIKKKITQLYKQNSPKGRKFEWKIILNESMKQFLSILESGIMPYNEYDHWFDYLSVLIFKSLSHQIKEEPMLFVKQMTLSREELAKYFKENYIMKDGVAIRKKKNV